MSNLPSIDELRDSFARVYNGADRLQREHGIIQEAECLNMSVETYRLLYELRGEEHVDPYPKPKKWWYTPSDWTVWLYKLPTKNKLVLFRKGAMKLVQSGVVVTFVVALGHYIWEAPTRRKEAHYKAWQIVNSASGQPASGGRIEALQDLNKDEVRLARLAINSADLSSINLKKAYLILANLQEDILNNANLQRAELYKANLSRSYLINANLQEADLKKALLEGVILQGANLQKANLEGASFKSNNFYSYENNERNEISDESHNYPKLRKDDLTESAISHTDDGQANLKEANFQKANLQKTDFRGANFQNTILKEADLLKADFRGAKNLTPEQVKAAKNWDKAHYDPELRKQLGLPPEPLPEPLPNYGKHISSP